MIKINRTGAQNTMPSAAKSAAKSTATADLSAKQQAQRTDAYNSPLFLIFWTASSWKQNAST
jgi:hypothetical protein